MKRKWSENQENRGCPSLPHPGLGSDIVGGGTCNAFTTGLCNTSFHPTCQHVIPEDPDHVDNSNIKHSSIRPMRANGTLLWQQTRRKENADKLNDKKGRRRRGEHARHAARLSVPGKEADIRVEKGTGSTGGPAVERATSSTRSFVRHTKRRPSGTSSVTTRGVSCTSSRRRTWFSVRSISTRSIFQSLPVVV